MTKSEAATGYFRNVVALRRGSCRSVSAESFWIGRLIWCAYVKFRLGESERERERERERDRVRVCL